MKKYIEFLIITSIFIFLINTFVQINLINVLNSFTFFQELIHARLFEPSSSSGEVSFCVPNQSMEDPEISFNLLNQSEPISEMFKINVSILNYIENEDFKVNFSISTRENPESNFLGSGIKQENSAIFNFETIRFHDKNCYYRVDYDLSTNRSFCWQSYTSRDIEEYPWISINNQIVQPIWNQFRNENSTDLDLYSPHWIIPNVTLYRKDVGQIDFLGRTVNFEQANLDEDIIFDQRSFYMNPNELYCLHGNMLITFFNLSYIIKPTLYFETSDCVQNGDCIRVSLTDENVTFLIKKPGQYFLKDEIQGYIKNINITGFHSDEVYVGDDLRLKINYTVPTYFEDFDFVTCNLNIYDPTGQFLDSVVLNQQETNSNENVSWATFVGNSYNITNDKGFYTAVANCSIERYPWDDAVKTESFYVYPWEVMSFFWTDTNPTKANFSATAELKRELSINYTKTIYNNDTPSSYLVVMTEDPFDETKSYYSIYDNYTCQIDWGDGTSSEYDLKEDYVLNYCEDFLCNNVSLSKFPHKYMWPGEYVVKISCDSNDLRYDDFDESSSILITNRLPILLYPIPNSTWLQGNAYSPYSLDDYFYDPDGEKLIYDYQKMNYIDVLINRSDALVTYLPNPFFVGSELTTFFASDNSLIPVPSNVVNLTLIPREIEEVKKPEEEEERSGEEQLALLCQELWNCTEWGQCMPSEIQTRKCFDINECNTTFNKPPEWRHCIYTPTCYDGLKNQGEFGVDCGGPCPPCPTCYDGIKNQGEEGIDCGGPCPPCPTCYDGIKNQGEEGIDCGGPCPPCREEQTPGLIRTILTNYLNQLLILLVLVVCLLIILPIAFRRIKHFNKFVINLVDKIIAVFSLPSFIEENSYANMLFEVNKLESYARRGNLNKAFNELDNLFRKFLYELFMKNEESTYTELKDVILNSRLKELDKLLFDSFIVDIENIKYSGTESLSRKRLLELINKLKTMIIKNKAILLDIQITKEIKQLEDLLKEGKRKEKYVAEQRILLHLLREIYLFNEKVNNDQIKDALQIYKTIKVLYQKLRWWNRIKAYNLISESLNKLKKRLKMKEVKKELIEAKSDRTTI